MLNASASAKCSVEKENWLRDCDTLSRFWGINAKVHDIFPNWTSVEFIKIIVFCGHKVTSVLLDFLLYVNCSSSIGDISIKY